MFADRRLLKKELSKVIGFYQTSNSEYPILSPSLASSTANRFVNDVHGLIDIENIDQTRTNFSLLNTDSWDAITAYSQTDLVENGGNYFEAVQNVPSGTLTSDTAYWFPLDDLNLYLWSKRLQGVEKTLDFVFTDKKMRGKVKSIYENIPLFDGVANYRDAETNGDKFVGLRFMVKHDRDLVTIINKIGHQFNGVASFNMYLYHSSQQSPIAIIPISHTAANSSQWTAPTDLEMRYLDDAYDAGGEFFLGYAQSELGAVQALNMYGLDWYNGFDCTTCNRSADYYENYSPWLFVSGFEIAEAEFTVGVDMFDPSKVGFTYGKNYGLNAVITNQCDLTPFFLSQSSLFGEAIQYSAGMEILRDMASNVRGTNNRANTVREEARKEVVTFDGVSGTVFDFTKDALKGMSFDLSGLQSACLPCDDGKEDLIMGIRTLS